MDNDKRVQLFEDGRICSVWDEENEEWLFSIIDVVSALTDHHTKRGKQLLDEA